MAERRQVTARAWRNSIIGAAFSIGLLIGGVVTGLFWSWPAWLAVVLVVSLLVQVVIWVRWKGSARRLGKERG